MKALIPVAGIGSKLRPHTHTQPKSLVPIAGKPILAHIIDDLRAGGITDFVFVLGYLGDKIEYFVKKTYGDSIKAEFILQEPREGLAHAVWSCKKQLENEKELLIVLGDTIAHLDISAIIKAKTSVVGVMKVSNPALFGVAELDEKTHQIIKLSEKPKIPKSNLALVGIYKIKNLKALFDAIEYIIKNNIKNNGEYHLTDALMRMITQGEVIFSQLVHHWYDCGRKETLLEANAILLNQDKFKQNLPQFPNTIIIPPVSIGDNCQLSNCIIGPNVAIGEDTIIEYSIVQNSIIGSFSGLENVVLKNSIIGNDTSIKGLSQSLNIGDSTELNFNK